MAKLKAPLLSFGASGKLADTLVYFPWKGLAVVRSYVIPANPNSAGQQTQRGILTESVASWHALGLDDDDVTAWNRYAASRPTPQSGFNAFVKDFVDLRVSGVILAATDMCSNGGPLQAAPPAPGARAASPPPPAPPAPAMAKLTALPDPPTIRRFRGLVDFYTWKGIPCARRWPNQHSPDRFHPPQTALRTPHLQQPFRRHPRVRCRTPL